MTNTRFSLVKYPWLFFLVFLIALIIFIGLIVALLVAVFKLPPDSPTIPFWGDLLGHVLLLFVVVPFLLGFHDRSRPYAAYLSEIRLTHVKPALQLILLGVSCFLIQALCMIAGTLIYRISQGGAIDLAFFRSAFPIASEFPPRSWGFLFSFPPSILEEVAFRGVILALFLRFYNKPKALLISALGFGAYHLLGLLSPVNNRELVWVAGQVVWASILGLFYGYITLKTDSLLPSMVVHYLGNLFIYPLTAYLQNNAPLTVQVSYGIILTLGIIPAVLMSLWVRVFTSKWSMTPST